MKFIGIDIGGTLIKYGLVDSNAKLTSFGQEETPKDYNGLINILENITNQLMDEKTEGLALSMPGVISKNVILSTGALTYIDKENFIDDLARRIKLPVTVVNDANAVALAEKWIGNAVDYNNFIAITLGTAVGSSIFINNKLHEGRNGFAGEIGMVYSIPSERTLIDTISAQCGVVAGACRKFSQESNYKTKDFRVIMQLASEGDVYANTTLEEFYWNNATLIFNTVCSVAPDLVLIGGSVSDNDQVVEHIVANYESICRSTKPFPKEFFPPVKACALTNESGIYGAVYYALGGYNEK